MYVYVRVKKGMDPNCEIGLGVGELDCYKCGAEMRQAVSKKMHYIVV